MEWLTNLLGFANNGGTSPFGALGGSTAMTPPGGGGGYDGPAGNIGFGTGVGPTGPIPAAAVPGGGGAPPQQSGGFQLPGIWGKMFGQNGGQPGAGQSSTSAQPGQTGGQNMALNQAFNLLKGPQMQPPPMMNLLSGPRR